MPNLIRTDRKSHERMCGQIITWLLCFNVALGAWLDFELLASSLAAGVVEQYVPNAGPAPFFMRIAPKPQPLGSYRIREGDFNIKILRTMVSGILFVYGLRRRTYDP